MTRRVLIVGHGRMGRLVESLCAEYGMQVAGAIGRDAAADPASWPEADVAIDFSLGEAVPANLPRLASRGMDVVIGTTGWQAQADALKEEAARYRVGVVAASNFALGVNLFAALAERAAELFASHPEFGAWIHELHHAAKRDAPSGTALLLRDSMSEAGFGRGIDMSSSRAGAIPGTHTVGFDSPSDTIELTHAARDRRGFAGGALVAARWLQGRRGWFTMADVLRAS